MQSFVSSWISKAWQVWELKLYLVSSISQVTSNLSLKSIRFEAEHTHVQSKNCSHYFFLMFNLKAMESHCLEVCYYRGESGDIIQIYFTKFSTWWIVPSMGMRVIRFSKYTRCHFVFFHRFLYICTKADVWTSTWWTQHSGKENKDTIR